MTFTRLYTNYTAFAGCFVYRKSWSLLIMGDNFSCQRQVVLKTRSIFALPGSEGMSGVLKML